MAYNHEEVRMIQNASLKIFKYFKAFCEKHHLTYFAIGGTCIGAIRHKGFIPWDDDIDVAMPVEDYYNFIKLCETELDYPYELVNPNDVKHYTAVYIKLQDASTTFVESFVEDYPDRYVGINMDIFPVYGLPGNIKVRNDLIKKNEMLKKINLKLRFPFSHQNHIKSKLIWIFLMPLRLYVPFYWATVKQQELFKYLPINSSEYVYFPWRGIPGTEGNGTYKNVFFYEDFSSTLEVAFEDTMIPVPIGYDRYLTMDFGNYMQIPPEDQQMPGHSKAIFDLEKSYKYYVKKKENSLN